MKILEEGGWREEEELVAGARVAVAVGVARGSHPPLLLLLVEVALMGSPLCPHQ